MKKTGGVAVITAAVFLAFYPISAMKDQTQKEGSLQEMEKPISEVLDGKDIVFPDDQAPVTFIDTIDGDTIKVWLNGKMKTVRYLLIDTPESTNPNICVQRYAKEASLRNSEVVKSGRLTLEFEHENIKDSYGRLLAYVYVDGKSVQETLLKEGYARVAYIMKPPYKYLERFREEETKAKRDKINIWSRLNFVTNWGFNGCLQ
jgi:micrococcal nuclease